MSWIEEEVRRQNLTSEQRLDAVAGKEASSAAPQAVAQRDGPLSSAGKEREEPYPLLRRAARLLNGNDLEGVSETLKEATKIMVRQGSNAGTPTLLAAEEKERKNDQRAGKQGRSQT